MTSENSYGGICRDRLTGLSATAPELTGTLIGRWVIDLGARGVFINSTAAARNDFLVPDPSGHWRILTETGERIAGTVARAQIPDKLEAESVRTVGNKLDDLVQRGASWREWLEVVPLVPGISEQIDLQPLESLVREHFGHLEAVCRKPQAHLHVEVERMPVSKARRMPAAAAAYLASHTEDWDRPLLRGILPKRILAEVRHDQLDIYENRVAARLLDNLTAYLNGRIRVLQRLLKVFQEKEDYSSGMGGTHQRRHRISELWGESIDTNEGRRKAEATLKELAWLKYKLMGLHGSTLYEEVPRRAFVPTTLKSTNVFTNDQHYRRVAELWREWARTGAGCTQSPKELNEEAQRLCRGMDAFSVLLTLRALDSLGYEPVDSDIDKALSRGTALRLEGHGIELLLRWQSDGTAAVVLNEHELAILALATDLSAGSEKQASDALARLNEAAQNRSASHSLVLYLSSTSNKDLPLLEPNLSQSLHTVGNDPRSALSGGGCLPVSPWEIGSTERLARALRWFLTPVRFQDYPQRIDVSPDARGLIQGEEHQRWLRSQNGDAVLEVISPPQEHEWKLLGIDFLLEGIRTEAAGARKEHQRISEELRRAVRDGRTGTLNRQKHEAHQAVRQCESRLAALEKVAAAFHDARERLTALLDCPTCRVAADPVRDFEIRDRAYFKCVCTGCRTEWGTRLCGNGHRYAVMLPNGDFMSTEDETAGWEDRSYGCDILALPARKDDGEWGFVCPECGQIG